MNEQQKLDSQLCFRLYTAARLTTSAYYPYLKPLGITYPQYLVLLVLWEKDRQQVGDIANRLMLETNTVTPLLQRMEKAGLIRRRKGKTDTRQRIISLTKEGWQLREKAAHIPECLAAIILEKVGHIEELTMFIPILDKLIDGLRKINKSLY